MKLKVNSRLTTFLAMTHISHDRIYEVIEKIAGQKIDGLDPESDVRLSEEQNAISNTIEKQLREEHGDVELTTDYTKIERTT